MRIHNVHSREPVASVERHERGRRVVFRFAPGSGLDGMHAFEVAPIDPWRARLTHTFDSRAGRKLLPVHRVPLATHDALLKDLLDNAERATGDGPAPRPPLPRLVRVADAVEGGLIRLRSNPLVSA